MSFKQEEYEAARMELLEEVARGASVEDLRAKLTGKNGTSESKEQFVSESKSNTSKSSIPDDLVQIQAYIRWERAGKQNYSAEQKLVKNQTFHTLSAVAVIIITHNIMYSHNKCSLYVWS